MPGMISDIILEHAEQRKRLIIDTKFTSVFGRSQHRAAVLKSGYIYQMYAYLRSQERVADALSLTASGIFIHPSIDIDLNESVCIQGHELHFVTVDLAKSVQCVVQRLRDIVLAPRTDLISA